MMRVYKEWHRFWSLFYQLLLKDCLDSEERQRLHKKMGYHTKKLSRPD